MPVQAVTLSGTVLKWRGSRIPRVGRSALLDIPEVFTTVYAQKMFRPKSLSYAYICTYTIDLLWLACTFSESQTVLSCSWNLHHIFRTKLRTFVISVLRLLQKPLNTKLCIVKYMILMICLICTPNSRTMIRATQKKPCSKNSNDIQIYISLCVDKTNIKHIYNNNLQ